MAYARGRASRALGEGIRRIGATAGMLGREREDLARQQTADEQARQDRDLQLAIGGIQRGAAPMVERSLGVPEPLDTSPLFAEPGPPELAGASGFIPEPSLGGMEAPVTQDVAPGFEQLTPEYYRSIPEPVDPLARERFNIDQGFTPSGGQIRDVPEPVDPLARAKYNVEQGFTPSGGQIRDDTTMSTEEANSEALTAIGQFRAEDGAIDWDELLKTAPPPPVRNAIMRYRNRMGEFDFGLGGPTFEAGGGGALTGDPEVDAILQGLGGGGERVRRGPGGGFEPAVAPGGVDRPTMAARVTELQAEGKTKEEARAIMLQEGYNVGGR